MLSDGNIRRINQQIHQKLHDLDSVFTDTPEKREEIRKDLIVLTDILSAHEGRKNEPEKSQSLVDDICEILRNRNR